MSEARSWSDTPPCEADGSSLLLSVTGGIDIRLAHELSGKTEAGAWTRT